MTDDDLTQSLEQTARRRVRDITPRPNPDELLTRLERRSSRQRTLLFTAVAAVLVIGSVSGYLVGHSTDETLAPGAVIALDDGVPASSASNGSYEPANVDAAEEEIDRAFQAAYDGGVAEETKFAAIQEGRSLRALTKASRVLAQRFGYTPEQLAGTTISVLDTSFIDDTHAIVHFTLSIPGHGPILFDRVGYAVLADGRWQVALRTACDLLSLSGLGEQCPPR